MAIRKLVVDEYGMSAVLFLEAGLHAVDLILRYLEAGPAIPLEAGGLAKTAEASYKATRGHGEAIAAILGALDSDGEAVGEEEQAAGDGLSILIDGAGHVENACVDTVVRMGVERTTISSSLGGLKEAQKKKSWEKEELGLGARSYLAVIIRGGAGSWPGAASLRGKQWELAGYPV